MKSQLHTSSALIILALLGAVPVHSAVAQGAGDQAPAASGNQLEEIVVTARRTEEKLQVTPVAVSALSHQQLDRLDIQDTSKIMQFVPNLYLGQGSGSNTNVAISIRGIGQQDPLLTVDSPVGFYVDGVSLSRISALNFDLVDLERVEVLRGPQGTLFGRNTTGGAVSLVTKSPAPDFGLQEKIGWGQYEGWYTRTELNTGELGRSGVRAILTFLHRDRDGWVDNPYAPSDRDPAALHSLAAWAKVEGEWDKLKVDYSFEWDHIAGQNEGFTLAAMTPANIAYYSQSPLYGGDPLVLTGKRRDPLPLYLPPFLAPEQHDFIMGHTLVGEYDLNDEVTFKSITGYRRWFASSRTLYGPHFRGPVIFPDPRFNPTTVNGVTVEDTPPFEAPQDTGQYQWSQELQVLGTIDRFKYVAGLFYFYEHVHEDNPNEFTIVLGPLGPVGPSFATVFTPELIYRENSSSYAGYGQVSYTPPILDDKVELTAGVRYTIDHRSIDVFYNQGNPFLPPAAEIQNRTGLHDFYNFNYLGEASYKFTTDIMGYIRFSSGYRAGGFNARQADPTVPFSFAPEKATAYEIGVKSEWFDHRLRANAAAYYTDYANLQLQEYTGGIGTTSNANAYYEGFELELQALPTKNLSVDGSVGYVNPVYEQFPYLVANAAGVLTQTNIASIGKFPYVPDWTIHLGVQYTFDDTPFGTPAIRADYSMTSERYFHTQNLPLAATGGASNPFNNVIKDPGQNLVSIRAMLQDIPVLDGKARMEVEVYGENLLDQDLRESAIDFGGLGFAGISYGMPRSFGFDVKVDY
ncbi:MAG TPA: TonB-dependent receptor [Alphaproteobacteria bacterium]|nr:TonB-dependent receptor [Alphaproteobacteria bacterium]